MMKASTGIPRLDRLGNGGIPRGRLTVVTGEAGLGKTILATQFLGSTLLDEKEPGIFVAFEEPCEPLEL